MDGQDDVRTSNWRGSKSNSKSSTNGQKHFTAWLHIVPTTRNPSLSVYINRHYIKTTNHSPHDVCELTPLWGVVHVLSLHKGILR
jgi:hypothetical protein